MLYAITDRRLYGTDEARCRQHLVEQAAAWAAHGVAFVQLREKDLPAREQVELARAMLQAMRSAGETAGASSGQRVPRLLINGRADLALAAGADGVHLPSGPDALTPGEVRRIFATAGRTQAPTVSVSCHTLSEVQTARREMPDCILFAPVFEKIARNDSLQTQRLPGTGLALLAETCRAAAPIPVFALGGVTAENAAQCIRAGAAGVAAIRLMQEPASAWAHLA